MFHEDVIGWKFKYKLIIDKMLILGFGKMYTYKDVVELEVII